jgi:hypothetical protein
LRILIVIFLFAQIAQSVEQRIENPRVGGSIPSLGTMRVFFLLLLLFLSNGITYFTVGFLSRRLLHKITII